MCSNSAGISQGGTFRSSRVPNHLLIPKDLGSMLYKILSKSQFCSCGLSSLLPISSPATSPCLNPKSGKVGESLSHHRREQCVMETEFRLQTSGSRSAQVTDLVCFPDESVTVENPQYIL